jgi:hypothetical protein
LQTKCQRGPFDLAQCEPRAVDVARLRQYLWSEEAHWVVEVELLLDDGAWTLEGAIRDVMLTFRRHRFRAIRGGSADSALITTLQRVLQSAPGEAICDACLAFACSVPLTDTREVTEALVRVEPEHFHRAMTSASCRRTDHEQRAGFPRQAPRGGRIPGMGSGTRARLRRHGREGRDESL